MEVRLETEEVLAGDSLNDFDVLDWMQLACDLEDEFEVSVSDVELEKRTSTESIAEYIESLLVEV